MKLFTKISIIMTSQKLALLAQTFYAFYSVSQFWIVIFLIIKCWIDFFNIMSVYILIHYLLTINTHPVDIECHKVKSAKVYLWIPEDDTFVQVFKQIQIWTANECWKRKSKIVHHFIWNMNMLWRHRYRLLVKYIPHYVPVMQSSNNI